MSNLVIRGGAIVTQHGLHLEDIAVEDGLISAVGPSLPGADREIDARGLTVFPGLIDVHLHFNEPGREDWEGIATGSAALAAGGGTAFFDMPLNSSPCTVDASSFDTKLAAMQELSIADFGLWGGIIPGNRDSLEELAYRGVIGFKAFLCNSGLPEFPRSDDLTLYEGMRIAAKLGLPVAVHAESEEITSGLTKRIRSQGRREVHDYLASRPVIAETEAIARAALLAEETGAKLHIVHISSGSGVVRALEARARGVDVTLETCPHYLFFGGSDMERIGAVAKCSPPLRSSQEKHHLLEALLTKRIHIVASDHSPSPPALKSGSDFFDLWGGIAGAQSTLPALLTLGVDPALAALLTSQNPAQRFGIPHKGQIQAGYDADLCLVDTNASFTLNGDDLFYRHKVSPYVGSTFRGVVRQTILRGQTIFADGSIATRNSGRLLRPQ